MKKDKKRIAELESEINRLQGAIQEVLKGLSKLVPIHFGDYKLYFQVDSYDDNFKLNKLLAYLEPLLEVLGVRLKTEAEIFKESLKNRGIQPRDTDR